MKDGSNGAKAVREADEGGERRRPTMVDVAAAAGVATATVSRYLSGQGLRGPNRQRVEEAIARLGYRRDALAAAMKGGRSNLIGFLVPALGEFHSAVLEHFSRRMHESGRAVLTFRHGERPGDVDEAIDFFASHRVDALLMAGDRRASEGTRLLLRQNVTVILYDHEMEGYALDRVLVDNSLASQRAVSHLIDLGHQRIGILAGDQQSYTGSERLAGYRKALETRGVPFDPALVVINDWSISSGNAGLQELLELPAPPTALLSTNYSQTYGALAALRERGLRCPDNLSLISFDDVPAFRYGEVGITCLSQPVARVAEALADLLARRLDPRGEPPPPARIVLECDLILRGSTQSLGASQT